MMFICNSSSMVQSFHPPFPAHFNFSSLPLSPSLQQPSNSLSFRLRLVSLSQFPFPLPLPLTLPPSISLACRVSSAPTPAPGLSNFLLQISACLPVLPMQAAKTLPPLPPVRTPPPTTTTKHSFLPVTLPQRRAGVSPHSRRWPRSAPRWLFEAREYRSCWEASAANLSDQPVRCPGVDVEAWSDERDLGETLGLGGVLRWYSGPLFDPKAPTNSRLSLAGTIEFSRMWLVLPVAACQNVRRGTKVSTEQAI